MALDQFQQLEQGVLGERAFGRSDQRYLLNQNQNFLLDVLGHFLVHQIQSKLQHFFLIEEIEKLKNDVGVIHVYVQIDSSD